MKVRSGFVSNSSSSSFVVVGFRRPADEAENPAYSNYLYDDDTIIVGEILAQGYCYFDPEEISIGDLVTAQHRVSQKYGVDLTEVQLLIGTKAC